MLVTNHVVILTLAVYISWWRHKMETFSALLALCAGNSPTTGEFSSQRPVTQSFDVFFDLRLNKRLSKQWWCRWFETPSRPLWRHCNAIVQMSTIHFCLLIQFIGCISVLVCGRWPFMTCRDHWFIKRNILIGKIIVPSNKNIVLYAKVLQITGFVFKYIVTTDQREILLNFRSVIITRMTVHCSL